MLFHAVPATWYLFRGFLVKPEKSCMQKGADCCPRTLKTLFQGPCNQSIKMKIKISQNLIVPVIEKVIVIVRITISGKPFN